MITTTKLVTQLTMITIQIFYSVGFTGMIFCVDVVTADTSSLRNRGLAFALTSSPYIITAFGGPKAAESVYAINWRWGYGAWAIVLPFVATPMIVMMQLGKRKAKKNGLVLKKPSSRTWSESLVHYLIEFDCKWDQLFSLHKV